MMWVVLVIYFLSHQIQRNFGKPRFCVKMYCQPLVQTIDVYKTKRLDGRDYVKMS